MRVILPVSHHDTVQSGAQQTIIFSPLTYREFFCKNAWNSSSQALKPFASTHFLDLDVTFKYLSKTYKRNMRLGQFVMEQGLTVAFVHEPIDALKLY